LQIDSVENERKELLRSTMSSAALAEKAAKAKMGWKARLTNRRQHIAERKAGGAKAKRGKQGKKDNRGCKGGGSERECDGEDEDEASEEDVEDKEGEHCGGGGGGGSGGGGGGDVVYECELDCGFASTDFEAVEQHELSCAERKGDGGGAGGDRKGAGGERAGTGGGTGAAGGAAVAESKDDDGGGGGSAAPAVNFAAGLATFGEDAEEAYLALLVRLARVLLPEAQAAMESAVACGDAAALRVAIHTMKGSAGYVGAEPLFELCADARAAIGGNVCTAEEPACAAAAAAAAAAVQAQWVEALLAEMARVVRLTRDDERTRALWDAFEESNDTG
jgi:hypothetical protein